MAVSAIANCLDFLEAIGTFGVERGALLVSQDASLPSDFFKDLVIAARQSASLISI